MAQGRPSALFLLLAATYSHGYVELDPVPVTAAKCGEITRIICYASSTNIITLSAGTSKQSFGSHTYERSSPHLATIGPLKLNLTKATVSPENRYLTNFNVTALEERQLAESVVVECADVSTSAKVEIKTRSQNCSEGSVQERKLENNTVLLQWDIPVCPALKNISHYTITLDSGDGNKKKYNVTEPSSLVVNTYSSVTITATNICRERYMIGTMNRWDPEPVTNNGIVNKDGVLVTAVCVLLAFY